MLVNKNKAEAPVALPGDFKAALQKNSQHQHAEMLTIKGWEAELHLDFVIFLLCVFSAEGEVIAFRGVLT